MHLRQALIEALSAVMRENGVTPPQDFPDDLPLLRTGLDSLGYAIVVARLEQELGYDPFLLMDEPVYPRTFGELVAIYERFRDRGSDARPGACG
jgi:hypothetical protein